MPSKRDLLIDTLRDRLAFISRCHDAGFPVEGAAVVVPVYEALLHLLEEERADPLGVLK